MFFKKTTFITVSTTLGISPSQFRHLLQKFNFISFLNFLSFGTNMPFILISSPSLPLYQFSTYFKFAWFERLLIFFPFELKKREAKHISVIMCSVNYQNGALKARNELGKCSSKNISSLLFRMHHNLHQWGSNRSSSGAT